MATISDRLIGGNLDYPTSDFKPMAVSDFHRDLMLSTIKTLEVHFQAEPEVYVSGNILVFYEPGNKRRHISPDVLVIRGVSKRQRHNYLIWEEGKVPDVVIELTSKSTRSEDVKKKKKALYRDVLRIPEYFLFDPHQEYLRPSMQGFRLVDGEYVPIEPVDGRLWSQALGLGLEREGKILRFVEAGRLVPTLDEIAAQARADADRAEDRADRAEAEVDRLRRELEDLRRRAGGSGAD